MRNQKAVLILRPGYGAADRLLIMKDRLWFRTQGIIDQVACAGQWLVAILRRSLWFLVAYHINGLLVGAWVRTFQ